MPTKEAAPGSSAPTAVGPQAISDVVVPLSASVASDSALLPAAELARRFGARVHLLAVGIERAEAETMSERLDHLAPGIPATVHVRVHWDVAGSTIAFTGDFLFPIVCMATHARGRLGEVALGSNASRLISQTRDPVLLVGPECDPSRSLADGPVFACVDGSPASEEVLPVAVRWAKALGQGLRIVTGVEPAPVRVDNRPAHRSHPAGDDPEAYLASLADRWRVPGLDVSGCVVYDPIGPAQGLTLQAGAAPCGLFAVTTHARTGLRRAVFGSQAAAILRRSPVPVLVVPPTSG